MLNHNYIGTEHILLGLIHEGEGADAKFTFTGSPKAITPDSPEDLAQTPTA
jgi:hypothetical protein